MKVTIKITDDKTWNDETPLEFELSEAKALYDKLHSVFGEKNSVFGEKIFKDGIRVNLTQYQIRELMGFCGCHDWKCIAAVPELSICIKESQIIKD